MATEALIFPHLTSPQSCQNKASRQSPAEHSKRLLLAVSNSRDEEGDDDRNGHEDGGGRRDYGGEKEKNGKKARKTDSREGGTAG